MGSKGKFLKRTQCMIDQYSNYTEKVNDEVIHLNGINTQGENIADTGGLKEAYQAYLRIAKRLGEEPRLPCMNYSHRQLFWLSAARLWCRVDRPEELKKQILTDFHSPARFRVIGPLSNLEEFSKDWGCPLG